jgi:hypothetical protein
MLAETLFAGAACVTIVYLYGADVWFRRFVGRYVRDNKEEVVYRNMRGNELRVVGRKVLAKAFIESSIWPWRAYQEWDRRRNEKFEV